MGKFCRLRDFSGFFRFFGRYLFQTSSEWFRTWNGKQEGNFGMFWRAFFSCVSAATIVMASGCVAMHPSACGVGAIGGGHGIGSCCGEPACGSGCGEVYWGEWINHPPKYGDPCDHHGNWVGAGSCGVGCWHPFQGLRNLWGYRFAPTGYEYTSSCSSCGPMEAHHDFLEHIPAEMYEDNELAPPPVPKPAPSRPNGDANGRQASRSSMFGGQVNHATYRQQR